MRTHGSTVTGRFAILVFRRGQFLRSVGVVKRKITLGSDTWADIYLEGEDMPGQIATISDRGEDLVFLELAADGSKVPLPLFEPVRLGLFMLVRVPAGLGLDEHIREMEDRLREDGETLPDDVDVEAGSQPE